MTLARQHVRGESSIPAPREWRNNKELKRMSEGSDDMTLIGETWELEPGSARQVLVPGHAPLAMVRLGDEFFVIDDTCTHGAASLCDGEIIDGEIECPFHAGRFDIRSGVAKLFPCTEPLRVYPVHIEGEKVYAVLRRKPIPKILNGESHDK